ncbi:MAG: hypothetical protein IJ220_01425 [Clostridia bacterium]|nr:hypothetical protein [Clostridia bacterium]
MKVLFALGSEQTSKRVAEKYLEKYGDELEYKNVFYFKALLDEVKKNKSYDRIVISEELEQFELKNIESLDKFIFNNVDNVTDEVEDSEIIFICSDRRTKDHDKFVERLFNIGVYNTLIGDERNITSLCEYIKNPMNKKQAKRHLNINPVVSDGTLSTRDDEVEEAQIMSILKYYDGIKGKTEEYLPAFDRISEQYSKNQLKVILNFLPADVKNEILSSERYIFLIDSNEYQNLQNFNNSQNNSNKQAKRGLFGIMKDNKNKEMYRKNTNSSFQGVFQNSNAPTSLEKERAKLEEEEEALKRAEEELRKKEEMSKKMDEELFKAQQEELRKRAEEEANKRKQMIEQEQSVQIEQDDFEKQQAQLRKLAEQQALQREQEELKKKAQQEAFEKAREEQMRKVAQEAVENVDKSEQEKLEEERMKIEKEKIALEEARRKLREQSEQYAKNSDMASQNRYSRGFNTNSAEKKIITLVGAPKSGVTFLANAISHQLSSANVLVGLLDMTKDNSLYYIYNQNDKGLRKIASECMQKLAEGVDSYIPANKNLKIYTSIPGSAESKRAYRNKAIIDTAKEANSVLLIDADFWTPYEYFEKAQEIYIVQDMDIMKMQETTMFIRDIKNRGIDTRKIKIIVNKYVKCLLTPKKLVEGLSYYNDPQMSFIDELLDSKVQYFMVPFNVENYAKYVDCVYKNVIDFRKFTPDFIEAIKEISNSVYRVDMSNMQTKKRGIFG